MRPRTDGQNNLFDKGKEAWERTNDFEKRITKVKQELRDKYQPRLNREKNWFKRQLIKIQFLIELFKIERFSSTIAHIFFLATVKLAF